MPKEDHGNHVGTQERKRIYDETQANREGTFEPRFSFLIEEHDFQISTRVSNYALMRHVKFIPTFSQMSSGMLAMSSHLQRSRVNL